MCIRDRVTSIGNNAFNNNKLSSIPDSWGQVTSIGSSAFYNNQLDKNPEYIQRGYTFTIPDKNLTQDFISNLSHSSIPHNENKPIYVFTENRSNPNNAKSTDRIKINPTLLTIKYVDEKGNPLTNDSGTPILQDYSEYIYDGINKTYTAPMIYGYKIVGQREINSDNILSSLSEEKNKNEATHTFEYQKLTEQELQQIRNTNVELSLIHI